MKSRHRKTASIVTRCLLTAVVLFTIWNTARSLERLLSWTGRGTQSPNAPPFNASGEIAIEALQAGGYWTFAGIDWRIIKGNQGSEKITRLISAAEKSLSPLVTPLERELIEVLAERTDGSVVAMPARIARLDTFGLKVAFHLRVINGRQRICLVEVSSSAAINDTIYFAPLQGEVSVVSHRSPVTLMRRSFKDCSVICTRWGQGGRMLSEFIEMHESPEAAVSGLRATGWVVETLPRVTSCGREFLCRHESGVLHLWFPKSESLRGNLAVVTVMSA